MSSVNISAPLLITPSQQFQVVQSSSIVSTIISDGFIKLESGIMSGLLPPVNNSDATNKEYVDSVIGSAAQGINRSLQFNNNNAFGGSTDLLWTTDNILFVTGSIISNSISTTTNTSVYLSATQLNIGSLQATSGLITGLSLPTNPSDAASKAYVDAIVPTTGNTIPQGPNNSIQFNNNGSFLGTSSLTWTTNNNTLNIDGIVTTTKVTGLALPINPTDAASKAYVDSIVPTTSPVNPQGPIGSIQFNLNGSSLGGSSSLSWNTITNVLDVSGTINAITNSSTIFFGTSFLGTDFIGTSFSGTSFSGSEITATTITSQNIFTTRITGLLNPVNNSDAANKAYVDAAIGSSPQGPFRAIQFNDDGVFGGSGSVLWTTTNILQINGGISVTSSIQIFDSTQSSSYTDGSFVVAGGVGIAKNVNINGTCSAQDYYTTSDITLKTNIKSINNPLEQIKRLNGYSFNWKNEDKLQFNKTKNGLKVITNPNSNLNYGFMAQDLEKNGFEFLVKNVSKHKTVNYTQIIALCAEGIKELAKQNEELTKRIEELENKSKNQNQDQFRNQ